MRHYQGSTTKYVMRRLKESFPWYLMLAPCLIYIFIFDYIPMYGVQIGFRQYNAAKGILGSDWVGLRHFARFFRYPYMWDLVKNTLTLTLYGLATFPMPVGLALILNEIRHKKYKKTVQMITYIPHFLTEVVVVSLVMLFLDPSTGPINNLIALLGGQKKNFMGFPSAFPHIYVWSGVWQGMGWGSILYLSALSSIDQELIEAARIDGANRFQIMRHINLPGITPTIIICLIMSCGGLLSVGYSKVLLLQNPMNLQTADTISTYVYSQGLKGGSFAYSSAIGLLNNVCNILILIIVNFICRRVSETSLF